MDTEQTSRSPVDDKAVEHQNAQQTADGTLKKQAQGAGDHLELKFPSDFEVVRDGVSLVEAESDQEHKIRIAKGNVFAKLCHSCSCFRLCL